MVAFLGALLNTLWSKYGDESFGMIKKNKIIMGNFRYIELTLAKKNDFSKVMNGLKGQAPYIEYCQC